MATQPGLDQAKSKPGAPSTGHHTVFPSVSGRRWVASGAALIGNAGLRQQLNLPHHNTGPSRFLILY